MEIRVVRRRTLWRHVAFSGAQALTVVGGAFVSGIFAFAVFVTLAPAAAGRSLPAALVLVFALPALVLVAWVAIRELRERRILPPRAERGIVETGTASEEEWAERVLAAHRRRS